MADSQTPVLGRARVARFELPGKRWYVAVCEQCCWTEGLSWRDKSWAQGAVDTHNRSKHSDEREVR